MLLLMHPQRIAAELGIYKYASAIKDNVKRILREKQALENGAVYYGFW